MDIMTHAKFYFNRLILTSIFGIRASEPPPPPLGPGERLKRPGLIGLKMPCFVDLCQPVEMSQRIKLRLPRNFEDFCMKKIHPNSFI